MHIHDVIDFSFVLIQALIIRITDGDRVVNVWMNLYRTGDVSNKSFLVLGLVIPILTARLYSSDALHPCYSDNSDINAVTDVPLSSYRNAGTILRGKHLVVT